MGKQQTAIVPNVPKVKTSIAMNPALWRQLRMRALQEGRTVFSILEQLAADYLTRPLRKGGR